MDTHYEVPLPGHRLLFEKMLSFDFVGGNRLLAVAAVEKQFGVSRFYHDLGGCSLLNVPCALLDLSEDHGAIQASMAVAKRCGMLD